jgi:hypothetical protein
MATEAMSSATSQVKQSTRTVKLYVGGDWDLVDEYNRIQVAKANPDSLAGYDRTREEEIKAELAAGTMVFKFKGLGHRSLQKLKDEHPPRPGKPRDQANGYNEDTATDALLRKCLLEPDLSDAALTELFEEQLTDGQYEQLALAVWQLNHRAVDIPFSLNGSTGPPTSEPG